MSQNRSTAPSSKRAADSHADGVDKRIIHGGYNYTSIAPHRDRVYHLDPRQRSNAMHVAPHGTMPAPQPPRPLVAPSMAAPHLPPRAMPAYTPHHVRNPPTPQHPFTPSQVQSPYQTDTIQGPSQRHPGSTYLGTANGPNPTVRMGPGVTISGASPMVTAPMAPRYQAHPPGRPQSAFQNTAQSQYGRVRGNDLPQGQSMRPEQRQQNIGAQQRQQHVGTQQLQQQIGTQQRQHHVGTQQRQHHVGTQQRQHVGTQQRQQHVGTQQLQQHVGVQQRQQHVGAQHQQQQIGAQQPYDTGVHQRQQNIGVQQPYNVGFQQPRNIGAQQRQQNIGFPQLQNNKVPEDLAQWQSITMQQLATPYIYLPAIQTCHRVPHYSESQYLYPYDILLVRHLDPKQRWIKYIQYHNLLATWMISPRNLQDFARKVSRKLQHDEYRKLNTWSADGSSQQRIQNDAAKGFYLSELNLSPEYRPTPLQNFQPNNIGVQRTLNLLEAWVNGLPAPVPPGAPNPQVGQIPGPRQPPGLDKSQGTKDTPIALSDDEDEVEDEDENGGEDDDEDKNEDEPVKMTTVERLDGMNPAVKRGAPTVTAASPKVPRTDDYIDLDEFLVFPDDNEEIASGTGIASSNGPDSGSASGSASAPVLGHAPIPTSGYVAATPTVAASVTAATTATAATSDSDSASVLGHAPVPTSSFVAATPTVAPTPNTAASAATTAAASASVPLFGHAPRPASGYVAATPTTATAASASTSASSPTSMSPPGPAKVLDSLSFKEWTDQWLRDKAIVDSTRPGDLPLALRTAVQQNKFRFKTPWQAYAAALKEQEDKEAERMRAEARRKAQKEARRESRKNYKDKIKAKKAGRQKGSKDEEKPTEAANQIDLQESVQEEEQQQPEHDNFEENDVGSPSSDQDDDQQEQEPENDVLIDDDLMNDALGFLEEYDEQSHAGSAHEATGTQLLPESATENAQDNPQPQPTEDIISGSAQNDPSAEEIDQDIDSLFEDDSNPVISSVDPVEELQAAEEVSPITHESGPSSVTEGDGESLFDEDEDDFDDAPQTSLHYSPESIAYEESDISDADDPDSDPEESVSGFNPGGITANTIPDDESDVSDADDSDSDSEEPVSGFNLEPAGVDTTSEDESDEDESDVSDADDADSEPEKMSAAAIEEQRKEVANIRAQIANWRRLISNSKSQVSNARWQQLIDTMNQRLAVLHEPAA